MTKTRLPITWTRDGSDWVCQLTVETKVSRRVTKDEISSSDANETERALRCVEDVIDEQIWISLGEFQRALAGTGVFEVEVKDD
jgi:poly-beta-hydroxyalkanoate depolymerase